MDEKDIRQAKKLRKALVKKALGYESVEVVEEYVSGEEGEIVLAKKKITKKEIPPDIAAIKMLAEQNVSPLESMTDQELEKEKIRLIKILAEQKNSKGDKNCKKE